MADTMQVPPDALVLDPPAATVPWRGRLVPAARQALRQPECLPLAGFSALSALGTALSPVLLVQPLALVLMSPRLVFMVLAASHLPLVPFVVLLSARLCATDVHHFRLGRRCGPSLLDRWPRLARFQQRSLRSQRALAVGAVALRPVGRHLVWAGSTGVSPRLVAAVDVLSTVVYCVAVHRGIGLLH